MLEGFSGAHLDLMDGTANLSQLGAVVHGAAQPLPYVVIDAAGPGGGVSAEMLARTWRR